MKDSLCYQDLYGDEYLLNTCRLSAWVIDSYKCFISKIIINSPNVTNIGRHFIVLNLITWIKKGKSMNFIENYWPNTTLHIIYDRHLWNTPLGSSTTRNAIGTTTSGANSMTIYELPGRSPHENTHNWFYVIVSCQDLKGRISNTYTGVTLPIVCGLSKLYLSQIFTDLRSKKKSCAKNLC